MELGDGPNGQLAITINQRELAQNRRIGAGLTADRNGVLPYWAVGLTSDDESNKRPGAPVLGQAVGRQGGTAEPVVASRGTGTGLGNPANDENRRQQSQRSVVA